MKIRSIAFVSVALAVGLSGAAACSSSSDNGSTGGSDAGSGTDSATGGDSSSPKDSGVVNDPDNCVPPGTKGNADGIGGYCSPIGGQCDYAGPGDAGRICTADLPGTPAHAWFCTYPCSHTSDCGENAVCFENDEGSGCIPNVCLSLAGGDAGHVIDDDAGTDAGDGG